MAITRVRRGEPFVVFPSQARTADATSDDFKIGGGPVTGLVLVIDATAIAATPSVTFVVRGYDPHTNKAYDIGTSAAVTAVSTKIVRVNPALTAAADIFKDMIPNYFRIFADHSDADSITYLVSAHLV